eukprot:COSAG06_NODE_1307_length_9916_cov_99.462361_5_plen_135_part_00
MLLLARPTRACRPRGALVLARGTRGTHTAIMRSCVAAAAVALLPALSDGHGAMTQPKSRNAVDGTVAPWNSSVPESVPFMFWCAAPDAKAADPRKVSGQHGQACFFFNNGCDISCDEWCAAQLTRTPRARRCHD